MSENTKPPCDAEMDAPPVLDYQPCEPLLSEEEIRARVSYHAPSEEGVARHGMLTDSFAHLMQMVNFICPNGREKALVMTKLEEAKMWASAAVARNAHTR